MNSAASKGKIIYPELSYKIMNVAYEVHNQLGPGFSEDFYEQAMVLEFKARGIPYEQQKVIRVCYKDQPLGIYRLDLVVDQKVIVELKAVPQLMDLFKAQLRSYLKASGLHLGILINFGSLKVEHDRILNAVDSTLLNG